MTAFETFGLSYRYLISHADLTSWLWAGIALLLSIFLIGHFWGMAWNRRWGLFSNGSAAVLGLVFGLLIAGAVLGRSGANRIIEWFEDERDQTIAQMNSDGRINREAFRSAWDKLAPRGGQTDLTPPEEGGNEIRLNSAEDAKIIALSSAESVKRPLQTRGLFALGVPVTLRDPSAVAEDVISAMPAPTYPVIITPSNEWSKAAVGRQVGAAIEYGSKALTRPVNQVRVALFWFTVCALILQVLLIACAAVSDIHENPRV